MASKIFLGNYPNQTAGGLAMHLYGVAVFSGRPANDDVKAAIAKMPVVGASEIADAGASWNFGDVEGETHHVVRVTEATSLASSIAVNNNATAYRITGAEISGGAGLRKYGDGTLWMDGANAFSGGLWIEGGTVVESGVRRTQNAKLGTGKATNNWANQLTLLNGVFDLNGSENYRNNSQTGSGYWGWLTTQPLTLGGKAGTTEIRNGVFGVGTTPAITYQVTELVEGYGAPGTATISAAYNFTGSSGQATREFRIGDSPATETEIDFTGGLHVENWVDGQATTIWKTGAGTMQLSSRFGFPGLEVRAGKVRMNWENVFVRGTVTMGGGTLDLNGFHQEVPTLAGTLGTVTSEAPATLTLTNASTFGGTLAGMVSLTAWAPVTLNGEVSTAGTLTVVRGGSLTLREMPARARIVVDCETFASMPNGMELPVLTIPGEVDEARIEWRGREKHPHLSWKRDPASGTWTLKAERTEDNFVVMPMGDSITEGSGGAEDAPNYRKALAKQMMAAGMNPRFVGARTFKSSTIENEDCRSHTGMSGHRVQTVNNRGGYLQGAQNWLEQAGYPDAVTLMIGTNDWINENQGTETITAGAATVFERWKALVKTMVAMRPDTWFIVSPITPPRSDRTDMATYVATYNAHIKGLFDLTTSAVEVNGERVTCVLGKLNDEGREVFGAGAKVIMASMFDAIPPENNAVYFVDNLHPSQAGYDRMAAVWLEAIKTLRGAQGGLKDAEAIVDAYQTAGAMDHVTVVFNRQQKSAEGVSLTVGGAEAAVSARTLSADGRRVTLTLAAPLTDGAEVSVAKDALTRAFTAKGATAESRVAGQMKGYVAVKTLEVPEKGAFNTDEKLKGAFTATPEAAGVEAYDRVGYYVTLARPDGALRYLWVSMDRPEAHASLDALGLPFDNLRTKVSNLRVASNVPGIEPVTEDGVQGLLQFGPNNMGTGAADNAHPVSLGSIYDWNSAFGKVRFGYGVMQIFRLYEEGVGRADSGMPASTLFSYSRWTATDGKNDEITLGDLAFHQGYNASPGTPASITSVFTTSFPTLNTAAYSVRRVEVWVRPQTRAPAELTWAGATEGTWNTTDASLWKEGLPFLALDRTTFGALRGDATAATVTVGEPVTPTALTVTQNAYAFAGEPITTTTLAVAANASATFTAPLTAIGATTVEGTLSVQEATFGQVPTGAGTLIKAGVGDLTLTLAGQGVVSAYEVTGGKLTLVKRNGGNGAFGRAPSLKVATGAHLTLDSHDMVGWTHENTTTVAEVSGVLEKTYGANETFSGRLLLKDGGELRNGAANFFLLHNSAIVEVEPNAQASITGEALKANSGTPGLKVGADATLTVSAPLTIPGGLTLKKSGAGTAVLPATIGGVGNFQIAEGVATASGELSYDPVLTVGQGGTLVLDGTLNKGGYSSTFEGVLRGSGTVIGNSGNQSATITLGATARVEVTPGKTLTLSPGVGPVSIAAGASLLAAGELRLANGYRKTGEGAITVTLAEDDTLAAGASRAVLTVEAGAAPKAEDFRVERAGHYLYVEGNTLYVSRFVTVDRPEGATGEHTPEALAAITDAARKLPATRVTQVRVVTKGGAAVTTDVATVNNVLACFAGCAAATANGDGTASVTVAYEFGVSDMVYERAPEAVTITVGVQGGAFARGVSLEFFAADGEGETLETGPTVAGDAQSVILLPGFPEWVTRPFKVRAVRE